MCAVDLTECLGDHGAPGCTLYVGALDVPILALPRFSFPLSDQRKSGWLPPNLDFTSGSGAELGVPYYWNIAPNRDATITPSLSTRRGFAVNGEFRYLEPDFAGRLNLDLLPYDQVYKDTRYWLTFDHTGKLDSDLRYEAQVERVSDDQWWNDFPRRHVALTPRLLPLVVAAEKDFGPPALGAELYVRTQRWQVLQAPNTMQAPFDRAAQMGVRSSGNLQAGLQYAIEAEANRFTLPNNPGYPVGSAPSDGSRLHAQGWINRPFRQPGWWVTPSVLFNAASYYTDEAMPDGRSSASRIIPTFSLGGGAEFERSTEWAGRSLRQTLEPRLLYVNTPYVNQSNYPNFDSAVKDYSFASIYSENVFSGIDRVSDTNAMTAGVTTRLLDATSGVELLQLGIVQRYLFRTQQVTPDGAPVTQRFSDVYLLGSTNVFSGWGLDAAVQYSADIARPVRSIVSARWQPEPFHTLSGTYRYARDLSEQFELGWQGRGKPKECRRHQGDGRRPKILPAACQPLGVAIDHFAPVIHPAHGAKADHDEQHHPYKPVAEIGPQQGRNGNRRQHQRAGGRLRVAVGERLERQPRHADHQ